MLRLLSLSPTAWSFTRRPAWHSMACLRERGPSNRHSLYSLCRLQYTAQTNKCRTCSRREGPLGTELSVAPRPTAGRALVAVGIYSSFPGSLPLICIVSKEGLFSLQTILLSPHVPYLLHGETLLVGRLCPVYYENPIVLHALMPRAGSTARAAAGSQARN